MVRKTFTPKYGCLKRPEQNLHQYAAFPCSGPMVEQTATGSVQVVGENTGGQGHRSITQYMSKAMDVLKGKSLETSGEPGILVLTPVFVLYAHTVKSL